MPSAIPRRAAVHTLLLILALAPAVRADWTFNGTTATQTTGSATLDSTLVANYSTFIQNGGNVTTNIWTLGTPQSLSYTINSGTFTANTNPFVLGVTGVGAAAFTQTGGTVNLNAGLRLQNPGTAETYYNLTGGTLNAAAVYFAGSLFTFDSAFLALRSGGTLVTSDIHADDIQSGRLYFDGGTLQANAAVASPAAGWIDANTWIYVTANGARIDTAGTNRVIAANFRRDRDLGSAADGGLTKLGAGTLTLTGEVETTNNITVSGGTLAFGDGVANNGAPFANIVNNATVAFNPAIKQWYSKVISGSGQLIKGGPGALELSGASSYSGGTTINSGFIEFRALNNFGTGNITLNGGGVRWLVDLFGIESRLAPLGPNGGTFDTNLHDTLFGATAITGTGGLTKAGLGTLSMTRQNTYTGGTFVTGGTLELANGGQIGNIRGALTIGSGATVLTSSVDGLGWGAGTKVDSITINGGTLRNTAAGSNGWGVAYILNNATMISNGGTPSTTAASHFSFGGLAGANTSVTAQSGTSTISGRINLRGDNGNTGVNFTVNTGATLSITAGISSSATAAGLPGDIDLTKNGAGTLILSGANTFTGFKRLDGGTLVLGSSTALGSGTIVFKGGTLQYGTGITTDYSPSIQSSFEAVRIDTNGNNVTYATALAASNVGGLVKSGTGSLTLGTANLYTGGTTVNGGTLKLTFGSSTGAIRGALTINAGATVDTNGIDALGYLAGTKVDTIQITGGTLNNTAAGNNGWGVAYTLSNATMISNSGTSNVAAASKFSFGNGTSVTVVADSGTSSISGRVDLRELNPGDNVNFTVNSGATLDVSAAISAGTAGVGFTKAGAGTMILSGANNYTGATALNGGTLVLGNATALGASGTITLGGGTLQFTNANTVDYSGRFSTAAGQQYKFDTNGQNVTLAAAPLSSSGGALTKLGAGTLTLTGANTYNGGTTLTGGTLSLGSSGALGTSGTINFGGGTLQFSGANTTDYSARFSTAAGQQYKFDTNGQNVTLAAALGSTGGTLTKLGTGTLTLTGATTYSGATAISGGTLALNQSVDSTLGGAISGAGALTKLGTGMLTLAADNSYTGGTTISAGTLQLGLGGTTGSVSGDITDNAKLVFNRSNISIYPGRISGSGSVTKTGAGKLTLSGSNTYGGGTTVTAGTLSLGNVAALGTGSIYVNAGATLDVASFSLDLTRLAADSGSGTITGTASFTYNSASNRTVGAILDGIASLSKQGTGDLTLTGNSILSGPSIVSGGRLLVDGSLTASLVTVQSGATLGGRGTMGALATVFAGGHLAPGDSVGTLTFANGLTLQGTGSGTVLDFDLGAVSDLIRVSGGTFTGPFGGKITLNILDSGSFGSGSYTLLDYSGASVTGFSASYFTIGTAPGGYDYAFATQGQTVKLLVTVPEPGAVGMLLGAGVVVLLRRRRR